MSRFNKNGNNLSSEQEDEWVKAHSVSSTPESKAEDDKGSKPEETEASNKQPDEGEQQEEPRKRRSLRRKKNKED